MGGRRIDAHTHAWGPPSTAHPWVNETIVRAVDRMDVDLVYTADDLLADMDANGVDEAVVVGYPICEWTDNWYTLRAAAEYDRLHGVVLLDHFADDAVERARRCLTTDGIVGIRIAPGMPYDQMWRTSSADPTEPTWLIDALEETAFWTVVRETDALVTIGVDHRTLDQVQRLVERYPDLRYLFDAYGPLQPDASDSTFEAFAEFADYGTVGVKASHTPALSNEPFPYGDVHDLLVWLLETFGQERVAWGSDYPNVTAHSDGATYPEASNWLRHVDAVSATDRRYVRSGAFTDLADLD